MVGGGQPRLDGGAGADQLIIERQGRGANEPNHGVLPELWRRDQQSRARFAAAAEPRWPRHSRRTRRPPRRRRRCRQQRSRRAGARQRRTPSAQGVTHGVPPAGQAPPPPTAPPAGGSPAGWQPAAKELDGTGSRSPPLAARRFWLRPSSRSCFSHSAGQRGRTSRALLSPGNRRFSYSRTAEQPPSPTPRRDCSRS